jgi:hypothetical protein
VGPIEEHGRKAPATTGVGVVSMAALNRRLVEGPARRAVSAKAPRSYHAPAPVDIAALIATIRMTSELVLTALALPTPTAYSVR